MLRKITIGLLIFGFVSSSLFLTSCGPSKEEIRKQEAAREAEAERVKQTELEKQREAERARQAELERQRQAERARQAEIERQREAERTARQALMEMESEKIYFDYDKSELKPEARAVLTKKAAWLRANPEYSITIEGHCDERGSTEYNLALGERRADAAAKFLSALGLSANRISTVSYGEEKPVDSRSNETAWAKNRRDEFVLAK